jgi:hypothetical protein
LYILPVNPDNVEVEIDLKSCQLIVALKVLRDCDPMQKPKQKEIRQGCDELLRDIKATAKRGESVWGKILPEDLKDVVDKPALKVLVYSLVFGCPLGQGMKQLVNNELEENGNHFRFTQAQIQQVLDGYLKPLVTAREVWMRHYSVTNITNSSLKQMHDRIKNASGHVFHLRKAKDEYLEQVGADKARYLENKREGRSQAQKWEPKVEESKIAGRALAHMCQGYEAHIMQSFLASPAMQENVLAFQYDGLTIECSHHEVQRVIDHYNAWLQEFDEDQTFEAVELCFYTNWLFGYTTCMHGVLNQSPLHVLERHFEKVNRKGQEFRNPADAFDINEDGGIIFHKPYNYVRM